MSDEHIDNWAHSRITSLERSIIRLANRVQNLEGKQQTPAPEPRPRLMYVDEVPADGTCEIRWWRYGDTWSGWNRVVEQYGASDEHERYFLFVGQSPVSGCRFKRDRAVQVRPVFDPQTGDTLGEVA